MTKIEHETVDKYAALLAQHPTASTHRKHGEPKPTCSTPECNRSVQARGLCKSHYNQINKGRTPAPLKPRSPNGIHHKKPCSFPDCHHTARAKGLCFGHYRQLNEGRPLATLRTRSPNRPPRKKVCLLPGCTEKTHREKLCKKHYAELQTLRNAAKYEHDNELYETSTEPYG
jgi:hypothetical protein